MHLRSYWSKTRLNGKPVEDGTFYLVSEFDDMHPIATMGASVDEVLAKSEYARAATEAELRKLRGSAQNGNSGRATASAPAGAPPSRQRLNANEMMQATTDLGNPAKAGEAAARLVQDATGVDLKKMALEALETRANEWMRETPEFFDHPGNRDLLMTHAMRAAGYDYASVSKEILAAQFDKLRQQGMLFEAPAAAAVAVEPITFPGGSPVRREEYTRGRQGTGVRSTSFRATQTMQPRTPKYTDDDIRKIPASQKRELIEKNDPDFAAACDRMYERAQASA